MYFILSLIHLNYKFINLW